MITCQQKQTNYDYECGERATFLAWTRDADLAEEDIQRSCTQHLAKAVRAAHDEAAGLGFVRVVPIPRGGRTVTAVAEGVGQR